MTIRSYTTMTFVLGVALLTCTNRIQAENLEVRVRALSVVAAVPESFSGNRYNLLQQGTTVLLEVESPIRLDLIDGDASQILELVDSNGNDFWPASLKIPQEDPDLINEYGPKQNGFQTKDRFLPEENSNRFLIGLHAFGQPSDGSTSFTLKAILVGLVPSEKTETLVAEEVLLESSQTFEAGGYTFEIGAVSFGGRTTNFKVDTRFQPTGLSITESDGQVLNLSGTEVEATTTGFKFSVKRDYYHHKKTVKLELTGNPPLQKEYTMEVPVSIGMAK